MHRVEVFVVGRANALELVTKIGARVLCAEQCSVKTPPLEVGHDLDPGHTELVRHPDLIADPTGKLPPTGGSVDATRPGGAVVSTGSPMTVCTPRDPEIVIGVIDVASNYVGQVPCLRAGPPIDDVVPGAEGSRPARGWVANPETIFVRAVRS